MTMQHNIKENSSEKSKKNNRAKNKKQNNDSYLNYLNSDMSDSVKNFSSFMSVDAIGVRMAKLKNKLKYTNALAPALRNLPDFCPTNPPFTTFKVINKDSNKNVSQKIDSKNKTSTDNFVSNADTLNNNNTNEIKNTNRKGKANSRKRKGENIKKNSKKSKKSKVKDNEMSKDLNLKTPYDKNNYNSTTIKKSDISGTITSTDVNKVDKSIINNLINNEKIDNEKKTLNNQNVQIDDKKINNQQILSRPKNAKEPQISQSSVDNMSNDHKDNSTYLEPVLIKKEIKHEKIKFSNDNNLTEKNKSISTTMPTQMKEEISHSSNINININNGIQNSINNSSNDVTVNHQVSTPLFNQTNVINNNINNNINIDSTNVLSGTIYKNSNNSMVTKVYTKKPKNQQIKTQPSTLSSSDNVYNPQSYPQTQNYKLKRTIYQPKQQTNTQLYQQSQIQQQTQKNLSVLREQVLQFQQQQQQQQQQREKQQLNDMISSHNQFHYSYLYNYNTQGNQRYSYPISSQQQIYYTKSKTSSSYPILNNNVSQVSNLTNNNVNFNSTLMNHISDANMNYNVLNSKKTVYYNQNQYPNQTVVNNLVNIPVNTNSSLVVNSVNYISNSTSKMSTLSIDTSGVTTNMNDSNYKSLISPVNNQSIIYPGQLVQSPVAKINNTTPIITSMGNNKLVYSSSVNTTTKKSSNDLQTMMNINANSKMEEIGHSQTPELSSTNLSEELLLQQTNSTLLSNFNKSSSSSSLKNDEIATKEVENINSVNTLNYNNLLVETNIIDNSNSNNNNLGKDNNKVIDTLESSITGRENNNYIQEKILEHNTNTLQKNLLKYENDNDNLTRINQDNELNTVSNINLSMINSSDFLKDDCEKTISNDSSSISYSNNSIFPTSTTYNKSTLPQLYTPSLSNMDEMKGNANEDTTYLYENITPPFSAKVSPEMIYKNEFSSEELTNSLNKIKANPWNEYINTSYIVDSLNSNSNLQYLEVDGKDSKTIVDKKDYVYSLGGTSELSNSQSLAIKDEQFNNLVTSNNLNVVASTSVTNPLDLLNMDSSKGEVSVSGISPIVTHPSVFKHNGNELYSMSMPLTLNNNVNGFTSVTSFPSPQYKSSVTLPLTPLSSRSISSSYS